MRRVEAQSGEKRLVSRGKIGITALALAAVMSLASCAQEEGGGTTAGGGSTMGGTTMGTTMGNMGGTTMGGTTMGGTTMGGTTMGTTGGTTN